MASEQRTARSLEGGSRARWRVAAVLVLLLAGFGVLEFLVPLGTAVQIGADEGFELAKATLCLRGYRLYTEVWNDQPPLHTLLVAAALKHLSLSILVPRLITVGFAIVLLGSVFLLALRLSGLAVAALTVGLVIASPGFIELSSSCMLEIPALAVGAAALATLVAFQRTGASRAPGQGDGSEREPGARSQGMFASAVEGGGKSVHLFSGLVFGLALQLKFTAGLLLPVAALVIWGEVARRRRIAAGLWFGVGLAAGFGVIHGLLGGEAYFRQLWASHFGPARSLEYGSAEEHRFDWSILAKNWDATLPALLGLIVGWRSGRRQGPGGLLPGAWLALALLVHALHRPWWSYYYIHIALPLCWNAAIGLVATWRFLKLRRRPVWAAFAALWAASALAWMGGRLYLQIRGIRESPQTYYCLVLKEIARLKPGVEWMYAADPIYSFHTGIPMPPNLAVIPLKRLWSGQMTNARIAEEMAAVKPGIILLRNDGQEVPFADLVSREYRLVYMDTEHLLYARRGAAPKAKR